MGTESEALAPSSVPDPFPSLYDYGLIGNLHTAALVRRTGSIDWACLPTFASPSVFARLLDRTKGGYFEVRPVEAAEGRQRYLPATNILETRFELPESRSFTLTDFMPTAPRWGDRKAAVIVRRAEALGGPVEVRIEAEPRFDYARAMPTFRSLPKGFVAEHGPDRLSVRAPGPAHFAEGRAEITITVRPGTPVDLELSWGGLRSSTPSPSGLLRATEHFWRGWVHGPQALLHQAAERYRSVAERSALLLKLLSHVDTGAFVAAPTTSIPEWPGGTRNWDYRFVWIRDAAFAAQELTLLGHATEARSFLTWVLRRIEETPPDAPERLRVLYGAHGETDLSERTLPHLAGFGGAQPVRIGNAAAEQFQLDIYGEFLDAALVLARIDPGFLRRRLKRLLLLADAVGERWRIPDRGIWEIRGPPAHYVHSKLMAWVALDRAVQLVEALGESDPRVPAWQATAEEIRAAILWEGWDAEHSTFRQAFGRDAIDAANLRIPMVGFLPFTDARVRGTIDRIARELSDGALVYRYRHPDGISEPEGAFLPCSFWLAECLARSGRLAEARDRFESLSTLAGPLGLLPEEYDPVGRLALGNYPQALSHVALLRVVLALGPGPDPATGASPPPPPDPSSPKPI
ncbi:MAG: glycoside hydrolase family 15 protein [Thermoplasmata archaeon]|nr:glycoside hydrolase family 15 protein [Thermoplasmata archaeon]